MTIYAIGDIHGQLGMLETALARIEVDGGSDAPVVFLGDYTDRGPDSRGVIDLLIKGMAEGRNWIPILGNHDRMFSMFMEDFPRTDPQLAVGLSWLHKRIGGLQTLASYGVEISEPLLTHIVHGQARENVPQSHLDFLASLPSHHEVDELLFVHAGIRPGIALADQTEDDKIWIRQEFLQYPAPHSHLVVHGHTPEKQAVHMGNRINLDSGAGYGQPLSTAVFEGTTVWNLTVMGRKPLVPQPRVPQKRPAPGIGGRLKRFFAPPRSK